MSPIPIPCWLCYPLGLFEAATHLIRLEHRDPEFVCRQHAETLARDERLVSWERLTS